MVCSTRIDIRNVSTAETDYLHSRHVLQHIRDNVNVLAPPSGMLRQLPSYTGRRLFELLFQLAEKSARTILPLLTPRSGSISITLRRRCLLGVIGPIAFPWRGGCRPCRS